MRYETIKHNKYNFYVQIDKESSQPVVIYHFDENREDLLNRITILTEPEYFMLPTREASIMQAFTPSYVVDCDMFSGLVDKATIVSGGSSVRLINHREVPITLVLAEGQSLYGIRESSWCDETRGSLFISKEFQKTPHEVYHIGHFPHLMRLSVLKFPQGFNSAAEFGATMPLVVDSFQVYDSHAGEIKQVSSGIENE